MAIQYSDAVRDAKLDAIESTISTAPIIRFYDGTEPAHCSTALSGNTLLAEGTLPSDWMGNASTGSKAKAGTWTLTGQTGAGSGTNATFGRIYDSAGTTCHVQFTVGVTADSPDVVLDNKNIADGQTITISSFSIADNNS